MHPNQKVFISFLSFILAMLVIACSCSTIMPQVNIPPIIPPSQTAPPPPTVTPPNPMTGLDGTWNNPETNDVYQIALQGSQYVVVSCTWQATSYSITSQTWTGSSLTWSYYDSDLALTVTFQTLSLSGDYLYTNWSYSDGRSGSLTLQRGAAQPPVQPPAQPPPSVPSSPGSLTLTSGEGGVVSNGAGVSLSIPAGAVPLKDDGSVGSMIFSIQQDVTTVPSLPGGYAPVGSVVNLGPEGFVFSMPIILSLPIPAGVDPNTVLGATYYDSGQGAWFLVPGSVDATNRTVEVATTHLSIWSAFGYGVNTPAVNAGWFKVYRPLESTPYKGPGSRYTRAATTHGICIRSVVYDDPNAWNWWTAPTDYTIMAYNLVGAFSVAPWSDAATYWMPSGSYQITEFYSQSEINEGDPLYVPQYYQMWRDYGTVIVQGGQTVEFPDPNPIYNESGWTLGRPPCWGTTTTSVGVGDLQVTLNWHSEADIDLHVFEPGGEEIWYSNTVSAAGGALDRDNMCANFEMGRPENIVWIIPPSGTYTVNVVYYGDCASAGPVSFTVRICIRGNCMDPIGGTVNAVGDTVTVTTFTFP
jgi:hypothetical protein